MNQALPVPTACAPASGQPPSLPSWPAARARSRRWGRLFRLAPLWLCSCGLAEFDVDRDIEEQRVAGNPLSGAVANLLGISIPMNVDIENETAARDTGPAKAVRLKALGFRITQTAVGEADEDDFDFLTSAEVLVESTDPGSALPRVRVATFDGAPGAQQIEFDTDRTVDLAPYADEGARFVSESRGSLPPDDVTFDGVFTVTIELL